MEKWYHAGFVFPKATPPHWSLITPITAFAVGYGTHRPLAMAIGMIWAAHIFFDRMLGYGLKYPTRFKDTHLQRVL